MICFTWVSIGKMYYPTVPESVFAQDMVHYDVILMGVDAYAGCLSESPVKKT